MNRIPSELELHSEVYSVVKKAAKLRGIKVEDLLSDSRKQEIITARFIAVYVARNSFEYGSKKLARMFGYKSHGSILDACKSIENWKDIYPMVRQMVSQLEEMTLHENMSLPARFQISEV